MNHTEQVQSQSNVGDKKGRTTVSHLDSVYFLKAVINETNRKQISRFIKFLSKP